MVQLAKIHKQIVCCVAVAREVTEASLVHRQMTDPETTAVENTSDNLS